MEERDYCEPDWKKLYELAMREVRDARSILVIGPGAEHYFRSVELRNLREPHDQVRREAGLDE